MNTQKLSKKRATRRNHQWAARSCIKRSVAASAIAPMTRRVLHGVLMLSLCALFACSDDAGSDGGGQSANNGFVNNAPNNGFVNNAPNNDVNNDSNNDPNNDVNRTGRLKVITTQGYGMMG